MTKYLNFIAGVIYLSISGCVSIEAYDKSIGRTIVIDQQNPQVQLATGEEILVVFNKQVPIESILVNDVQMIFTESNELGIRGKISSELWGYCEDTDSGSNCGNEEAVGRVIEVNYHDIDQITVWKTRIKTYPKI